MTHVFFRLVCRNGFFSHRKSKLILLKVFLNLVWSLQDGLWNSMQCSCTEIGNGTSTLWHIVLFPSSQFCTQHVKDHLLMRPDGRHSTFHVENQQLNIWLDTCLLMMMQFPHTQTEYEFQDLCIILLLVYNCFGINTNLKGATIKSENVLTSPEGSRVYSLLWISVVGWLVSVLGRQLQYSAIWWNIYAKPST